MSNRNYGIFIWTYLIVVAWIILQCLYSQVYYAAVVYLHALALLLSLLPIAGWGMNRMLLLALSLLGFLFHAKNQSKSGLTVVDLGCRQIISADSCHPEVYFMERTLADGTIFKGNARSSDYGIFQVIDFDGPVKVYWKNGDSLDGCYEKGKLKNGRLYSDEERFVYDGELRENPGRPRSTWWDGYGYFYGDSSICCTGLFSKGEWLGYGWLYVNGGRKFRVERFDGDLGAACKMSSNDDVYVWNSRQGESTVYGRFYYKEGCYYQGFFKDRDFVNGGALYDASGVLIDRVPKGTVSPDSLPAALREKLEAARRKAHTGDMAQAEEPEKSVDADVSRKKVAGDTATEIAPGIFVVDDPSKVSIEESRRKREMPYYSLPPVEIRKLVSKEGKKFERVKFEEFHPLSDEPGERAMDRTGKVERYLEGEHAVAFKNGDLYTGQWHNGLRHGHGKMNYANGDIYEGDWVNGQRTGKGEYLTTDRQRFVGDFVNGELHGMAVHYDDPTRKIIYNGRWEKGKTVSSKAKR